MRLLLTGATGFLGQHIAGAATGWEVTRVTRALKASDPDEVALGPSPWSQADFVKVLSLTQPDVVLHCAGATHSANVRACIDTNVLLAAELLAAAAELPKLPRIVLIGSAAEYGVVPVVAQPVVETHPCAPRTDYAVAKYTQSLLGFAAAMRGQQVIVARLFNPVGVGMPAGLALPSFARRIAEAGPNSIVRVGDMSAERDFLDVEEAARLLLHLAAMPHWPWPVVNICSGRAYRLSDLLDCMIAASGVRIKIESDPALMRPGDMPTLTGSIERLRSVGLVPRAPDFSLLLPRLLTEAQKSAAGL